MSARKLVYGLYFILIACIPPRIAIPMINNPIYPSLACDSVAKQLGWVECNDNWCGGYYLEPPLVYLESIPKNNAFEISSQKGVYARRGTSVLEENVTVTRTNQQMTGNKAYLYRDPQTGKLKAIDIIGNVHLREANTLIVAEKGHYDFDTESKSLQNIYFRTTLTAKRKIEGPKVPLEALQNERQITALTAWGKADQASSTEPKVYEFYHCTYSTCPPTNPAWQIQASHIELDKNKGRGYATHARFLLKNIPVFYVPYFNFSIDKTRKSGFLWPTVGLSSNKWGPYFFLPFYWNMAPNYDMTITPGYLTKRGAILSDNFRYLTHTSKGRLNTSMLPYDRAFKNFQNEVRENPKAAKAKLGQDPSITQGEINRLLRASPTRAGISWKDKSRFNSNWSSFVDFNYVTDDYYLRDYGRNISEITENQLLQEADLYYSSQNWNFTGRVQAYQTLHPVNENFVANQYRRLPQLVVSADYPDQPFGLEFFMTSEFTHFNISSDPGVHFSKPIGNRFHFQPGVSLPIYLPYFFFNPRIQYAFTQYNVQQVDEGHISRSIHRIDPRRVSKSAHRNLPIFDLLTGLSFTREFILFNEEYQQTLEPQAYYTYIPFYNQRHIPIFDTTVNTLTYDQIFNYNRFTGIDRIGDANQLGLGVTSRFINQEVGIEKVRMGLGGIIYFANRRVTLCNNKSCTDNPKNVNDRRTVSPLTAFFNYSINPQWTFTSNLIWNPYNKTLDNSTLSFHYQPDPERIINLSFSYARNYDILSGITVNSGKNNVKVTDVSFAWPIIYGISAMGRWTQDWNGNHFQNLFYGLQYETCCWAVRMVGGKAFTHLVHNRPSYRGHFYIQFDLKGLGNVGSDPKRLLSSISGYNTQFGRDI